MSFLKRRASNKKSKVRRLFVSAINLCMFYSNIKPNLWYIRVRIRISSVIAAVW